MKDTRTHLERFVQSYLATAQWSSSENDSGDLDEFEWSQQAKDQATKDCQEFIDKVNKAFSPDTANYILNREASDLEYLAPHDFWLTRVGHGAGFWDGDWDDEAIETDLGKRLTEISQSFNRSTYVYRGDDNLLYFG